LEVISRRAACGRVDDGHKLALVVEGGAMRGAYSLGGLIGLESLGFGTVFDEVYGSSAGAINAAYFVAGQATASASIYYRQAADRRFINPFRLLKICDIDYLFDHILAAVNPLDIEAVNAARSRLLVALADSRDARLFLLDACLSSTPLMTLLKASSALPVFYQRTVAVGDRLCVDGSFPVMIPIKEVLARGATHVMVLLTQPASFEEPQPQAIYRWLFARLCSRGSRRFAATLRRSVVRSNAVRRLVLGRSAEGSPAAFATFCPEEGPEAVDRTTIVPSRLKAALEEMTEKVQLAFGGVGA
jgi:predicted patatin/cPLA2 family phospholipase